MNATPGQYDQFKRLVVAYGYSTRSRSRRSESESESQHNEVPTSTDRPVVGNRTYYMYTAWSLERQIHFSKSGLASYKEYTKKRRTKEVSLLVGHTIENENDNDNDKYDILFLRNVPGGFIPATTTHRVLCTLKSGSTILIRKAIDDLIKPRRSRSCNSEYDTHTIVIKNFQIMFDATDGCSHATVVINHKKYKQFWLKVCNSHSTNEHKLSYDNSNPVYAIVSPETTSKSDSSSYLVDNVLISSHEKQPASNPVIEPEPETTSELSRLEEVVENSATPIYAPEQYNEQLREEFYDATTKWVKSLISGHTADLDINMSIRLLITFNLKYKKEFKNFSNNTHVLSQLCNTKNTIIDTYTKEKWAMTLAGLREREPDSGVSKYLAPWPSTDEGNWLLCQPIDLSLHCMTHFSSKLNQNVYCFRCYNTSAHKFNIRRWFERRSDKLVGSWSLGVVFNIDNLHWTASFIHRTSDNECTLHYHDSFGNDPSRDIEKLIKEIQTQLADYCEITRRVINRSKFQKSGDECGHHAIRFLRHWIYEGVPIYNESKLKLLDISPPSKHREDLFSTDAHPTQLDSQFWPRHASTNEKKLQKLRGVVTKDFLLLHGYQPATTYKKEIGAAKELFSSLTLNAYETGGEGDCFFHVINASLKLMYEDFRDELNKIKELQDWQEHRTMESVRGLSAKGMLAMKNKDFVYTISLAYVALKNESELTEMDEYRLKHFESIIKELGIKLKEEPSPSIASIELLHFISEPYEPYELYELYVTYDNDENSIFESSLEKITKGKEIMAEHIRKSGSFHEGTDIDAQYISEYTGLGIIIIDAQNAQIDKRRASIYQGCAYYRNCKFLIFVLAVNGHYLWPLMTPITKKQYYGYGIINCAELNNELNNELSKINDVLRKECRIQQS